MQSSFWEGRSVLVTGGSGLLGGWLVPALVRQGASVVLLVRDAAPQSMLVRDGWLSSLPTVYGSVTDADLVRRALAEYSVKTVFHLAAQTQVGVAKVDPVGTLEANVRGTWNLLEAARLCGGIHVIAASSDKAYGQADKLPYEENYPLQGKYPYDVSKSCMDLICTMYATSFGLPVLIARCANLFGGGDLNFARVIPGLIQSTLRGEPFVIRSDGQFVRDYLYVEDAADAYMCMAEFLAHHEPSRGEAFNISMEARRTVLELVDSVLSALDRRDLKPIIMNQASNEIRAQALSSDKARRVLGWTPKFTFDQAIARTIAWYQDYFNARHENQKPTAQLAASLSA